MRRITLQDSEFVRWYAATGRHRSTLNAPAMYGTSLITGLLQHAVDIDGKAFR